MDTVEPACSGATYLNKDFALEKALFQIVGVGGVPLIQEGREGKICYDETL